MSAEFCVHVRSTRWGIIWLCLLGFLTPPLALAQDSSLRAPLPQELPWQGKSEALIVGKDDKWVTPAEASDFKFSPSYDETVCWFKRLVDASKVLHMMSIGRSFEGRDIWMIIASSEARFSPQELAKSGKPTLFVQGGIHPGEIDGKDAAMMLLRDMSVGGSKAELLDVCNLLVVPILSVDGHENCSVFGRINQRGPEVMGWRTNARNQNLNRDYAKLDSPELRALICALDLWQPDLYFDIHVTDGIDYQYDITFGYTSTDGYSPAIAKWLDETFTPEISSDLRAMGHIPGPLIFAIDNTDLSKGIVDWVGSPRFSSGYGDVRHLPTVLVENHSLKPFRQRVLGTYVFLESSMRLLGKNAGILRSATQEDRKRFSAEVPLSFTWNPKTIEGKPFAGVSYRVETSEISGGPVTRWLGVAQDMELPIRQRNIPSVTVDRPAAYWILPAWPEVIDRLRLHGIEMDVTTKSVKLALEQTRVTSYTLDTKPYEGHVRLQADLKYEKAVWNLPEGSVRISTAQPLGDLAVLLLEPESADSFFQWGFFLESLQRAEYYEDYVMEPLAAKMLEADPDLKIAFEKRCLEDPKFATDPDARLNWFYRQTRYYDSRYMVLPVAREMPSVSPNHESEKTKASSFGKQLD